MSKIVSLFPKLDLEQRFQRGLNLITEGNLFQSFQVMHEIMLDKDISSELYLDAAINLLRLYHDIGNQTRRPPEQIEVVFEKLFLEGEVLDVSEYWLCAAHETIDIRLLLSYLHTDERYDHLSHASDLVDDCMQELNTGGYTPDCHFSTFGYLTRVVEDKADFIRNASSPKELEIVAKICDEYGCDQEQIYQDLLHMAEMNVENCMEIRPKDANLQARLNNIQRKMDGL